MDLREKARWWLKSEILECYRTQHPSHGGETTIEGEKCDELIHSLAALLTASVADAVAQEREACAKEVPTTWLHPMFIDNDKLDGPTTEWICKQVALAIRARTTTPTPSPSGEQPGVKHNGGHSPYDPGRGYDGDGD